VLEVFNIKFKFFRNLEEITMKHFNYKLMSFMEVYLQNIRNIDNLMRTKKFKGHISRLEDRNELHVFTALLTFFLSYTILKALYEDRTKFINLPITSIIRNHL
uniref:Uncharacterized protein n=1 Tax=Strongyloides stercoralis TaxID=6248 RepID=A0AAF5DJ60_STRER